MWCLGLALVGHLSAQVPLTLIDDAPFLKEPGGVRLVTLVKGLRLRPGRIQGSHVEVSVQGWLFTASTQPDKRDGFDVSVREPAGENLRAEPDGAVLGRAVMGALFNRVGARGGWSMVRRSGWVPRSAFTQPQRVVAAPPPPPAPIVRPVRESTPAAVPAAPPSAASPPPDTVRTERGGSLRAGTALQKTPEGVSVATLTQATDVTIAERDRDWVKVRVEGWVKVGDVTGAIQPPPAITAAMLRDNPDKYVGQMVDWRLQFLAHQKADELRPEMPLGHPYLLARGPLPETGFVYLLVSKDQADRLRALKPLDELAVMVTVRAGRTRYLATPVVELVRLAGADSRTP